MSAHNSAKDTRGFSCAFKLFIFNFYHEVGDDFCTLQHLFVHVRQKGDEEVSS